MKKSFIYIALLIGLVVAACNKNKQVDIEIINNLMGKELFFSDNLIFNIKDKVVENNILNCKFKIISIIDSSECNSCKMRLDSWSQFKGDMIAISKENIECLLVLNISNKESIIDIVHEYNYQSPICIDEHSFFRNVNNLPKNEIINTFLLDSCNKIIAIGNPIINPKIKNIYKKLIKADSHYNIPILCDKNVKSIGISYQDSISTTFRLANISNSNYIIKDFKSFSKNISSNHHYDTLKPKDFMDIDITYHLDNLPNGPFFDLLEIQYTNDQHEYLTIYGYKLKQT